MITGDRGLAGAFNSQIIRAGVRRSAEWGEDGASTTWYATGRRGVSSVTLPRLRAFRQLRGLCRPPRLRGRQAIADDLISAYVDGHLDRVEMVYNALRSPLTQRRRAPDAAAESRTIVLARDGWQRARARARSCEYEPDAELILRRLVPDYVEISIYRALLESAAGYLAARSMTRCATRRKTPAR